MPQETIQTTEEQAHTSVLASLGVDGWKLVPQLLNFLIVVLVMWRWVYRPLLKKMDERTEKIKSGLAASEQGTRALAEANAEREEIIRQAKQEAHRAVEEARVKAETYHATAMVQAKDEIEKVVAEAKERIAQERVASLDALQREVASLISLALTKIAGDFDEKTKHALIDTAIAEISKGKKNV